jgi:hypothetical protein
VRRDAEGHHAHTARVEVADDVLDGAVLARGVAALKHDQHAARLRGEHLVLQREEPSPSSARRGSAFSRVISFGGSAETSSRRTLPPGWSKNVLGMLR